MGISIRLTEFPNFLRYSFHCSFPSNIILPSFKYYVILFFGLFFILLATMPNNITASEILDPHSARGKDLFFQKAGDCQIYPNCMCFNSVEKYSVHCPWIAFIELTKENDHVSLNCYSPYVDPFKYLNILNSLPDGKRNVTAQEISLTVNNCPLPKDSYISYFLGNPRLSRDRIKYLNINCGSVDKFPLNGSHLQGFSSLVELHVTCKALKTITPDLMDGVSDKLEELALISTSVKTLPQNLTSKFTRLLRLGLHMNKIKSLPKNIFDGNRNLDILSLRYNMLERLDEDIFSRIQNISWLDISGNRLKKLPKGICSLTKLELLFVRDNSLEYFESGCLTNLSSLQRLDMSGNRFHVLTSGFMVGMVNTTYLDSGLNSSVPRYNENNSRNSDISKIDFSKNELLRNLNMSNIGITTLLEKTFFYNLKLVRLYLSSNLLRDIPAQLFERNVKLESLDLSKNSLSSLPENLLSNLKNLGYLVLSKNRIESMENKFFSGLQNLRYVDLSDNLMQKLPNDLFLPFNHSTSLKFLNLKRNNLTSLPRMTIPSVTDLNLAENNLLVISDILVSSLKSLENLNISFNKLSAFWMGHLTIPPFIEPISTPVNLSSFDISHNSLNEFYLLHLEKNDANFLNISQNNISKAVILNKYVHVDISNNRLEFLPLFEGYFGHSQTQFATKYLDVSTNNITFEQGYVEYDKNVKIWGYDSKISVFVCLEVLLLHHNNIDFIPLDFRRNFPNLRLLDLSFNKIKYLNRQDLLFTNGITAPFPQYPCITKNCYVKKEDIFYQFTESKNLTVDLRHNLIEGIELPYNKTADVSQDCHVERRFSRVTIFLGDNPLRCDCQVFPLIRYWQKELRPVSDLELEDGKMFVLPAAIDISGLTCSEPPSMKGKNLSDPETWIHHLLPALGLCVLSSDYFEHNNRTDDIPGSG